MDKKEILNEWLRQTDQTYINEGHKIVILNAMEEYAMQQVKNCSIPVVSHCDDDTKDLIEHSKRVIDLIRDKSGIAVKLLGNRINKKLEQLK